MPHFEQRSTAAPGDKMERGMHPADMLRKRLGYQSQETNMRLKEQYAVENLLDANGMINPEGYAELYGAEAMKLDGEFIEKEEIRHSGARDYSIQEYYREKYGTKNEAEHIARWYQIRAREKSTQMEMAVTLLLSQKLGKDFLVVRTALYDDFKGVDNLIVDLVTGEVVGAFDDVHEGGTGANIERKKAKTQKVALRGGANIRYGLMVVDGKLVRAPLEGVPVFFLGLKSKQPAELIEGIEGGDSEKTDGIFFELIQSLRTQSAEFEQIASSSQFKQRLASFNASLSRVTDN